MFILIFANPLGCSWTLETASRDRGDGGQAQHDLEEERFSAYPEIRRRPSIQQLAAGLGVPFSASDPASDDDDFLPLPLSLTPNTQKLSTFSSRHSPRKSNAPSSQVSLLPVLSSYSSSSTSDETTSIFPLTVCRFVFIFVLWPISLI